MASFTVSSATLRRAAQAVRGFTKDARGQARYICLSIDGKSAYVCAGGPHGAGMVSIASDVKGRSGSGKFLLLPSDFAAVSHCEAGKGDCRVSVKTMKDKIVFQSRHRKVTVDMKSGEKYPDFASDIRKVVSSAKSSSCVISGKVLERASSVIGAMSEGRGRTPNVTIVDAPGVSAVIKIGSFQGYIRGRKKTTMPAPKATTEAAPKAQKFTGLKFKDDGRTQRANKERLKNVKIRKNEKRRQTSLAYFEDGFVWKVSVRGRGIGSVFAKTKAAAKKKATALLLCKATDGCTATISRIVAPGKPGRPKKADTKPKTKTKTKTDTKPKPKPKTKTAQRKVERSKKKAATAEEKKAYSNGSKFKVAKKGRGGGTTYHKTKAQAEKKAKTLTGTIYFTEILAPEPPKKPGRPKKDDKAKPAQKNGSKKNGSKKNGSKKASTKKNGSKPKKGGKGGLAEMLQAAAIKL